MAKAMTYMEAYVSNNQVWYPKKTSEQEVIRKIIRDAWLAGYNVKTIAGYFKLKPCTIYDKINIRGLKLKRAERVLESKGN